MQARGRNGEFKVDRIEADLIDSRCEVYIALYSKSRIALDAPVRIFGGTDEIIRFCQFVLVKCGVPAQELEDLITRTLMGTKLGGGEVPHG